MGEEKKHLLDKLHLVSAHQSSFRAPRGILGQVKGLLQQDMYTNTCPDTHTHTHTYSHFQSTCYRSLAFSPPGSGAVQPSPAQPRSGQVSPVEQGNTVLLW